MTARRILLYNTRRSLRRERVFRDRLNPFDIYDDNEFYQRFRFDKASVQFVINYFGENLESTTNYHPIDASTKILVTLRYMASNALQQVVGDIFGLSQPAVNRIIWKVITRIAQKVNDYAIHQQTVQSQLSCVSYLGQLVYSSLLVCMG